MPLSEELARINREQAEELLPRYAELMHKPDRTPEDVAELSRLVGKLGVDASLIDYHDAAIREVREMEASLLTPAQIQLAEDEYQKATDAAKESIKSILCSAIDAHGNLPQLVAYLSNTAAPLYPHTRLNIADACSNLPMPGSVFRQNNLRLRDDIHKTKVANPAVFPEAQRRLERASSNGVTIQ